MRAQTAIFSVVLLAVAGGGGGYGVSWWQANRYLVTTDNAYVRGHVAVIGALVDGEVETVHVMNNDHVHAGDPLVTFVAAPYEAAVDGARAELRAARAEVGVGRAAIENLRARRRLQQSLIAQAEARLAAARAQAENAARELERYRALFEREIGSRQKYEQVMTEHRMRTAEVSRGEAELAAARNQLPVIDSEIQRLQSDLVRRQAMVANSQAQLDRAEIALSHTVVYASVDGVISNRKVEPGMYMEAGWPMLSLVPLGVTWVVANFKETQLENVRVGQPVLLAIDAFPAHPVIARVDSFAPASAAEFSLLPPQNTTGNFIKVVQRIPVRLTYELPPELQGRVVPGMSVVATIDTSAAPAGPALAVDIPGGKITR